MENSFAPNRHQRCFNNSMEQKRDVIKEMAGTIGCYPDSFQVSGIVSTVPAWLLVQVLIIARRTLIELHLIIPPASIMRANNYRPKRLFDFRL